MNRYSKTRIKWTSFIICKLIDKFRDKVLNVLRGIQNVFVWHYVLQCTGIKHHTRISQLQLCEAEKITTSTLTHWGRVTHICVGKLTIIGSDNGLSPERPQAIIWTNAGILLIGPLGTNFSEILIEIQTFFTEENTFENVVCKMLFISSRPQCVNVPQPFSV